MVSETDSTEYTRILFGPSWPIAYVTMDNLVNVGDGKEIYRHGFNHLELEADMGTFREYYEKHHRAPPAPEYAICYPNLRSRQPGIEIMASSELFQDNGRLFSMICSDQKMIAPDGLDFYKYKRFLNSKNGRLRKIDKFLAEKLYAFDKDEHAYSRNLVNLIRECHSSPGSMYQLEVLEKDGITRKNFSDIDLDEAISQGVFVDIDWLFANKILGLFGTSAASK